MEECLDIKDLKVNSLELNEEKANPIVVLNEYSQKNKIQRPVYVSNEQGGPDHLPTFSVQCNFQDKTFVGTASSIKQAKENAALQTVNHFGIESCKESKKEKSLKIIQITPSDENGQVLPFESLWDNTCSKILIIMKKTEKHPFNEQFKTFEFTSHSLTDLLFTDSPTE
jgi:hypothetical protein